MVRKRRKLTAFGRAVKKGVIDKNMSLADLASMLGISRQQLTNILVGDSPGYKYRNKMVDILELPEKWEVLA